MKFTSGDGKAAFEHTASHVIHLTMPHITESGGLRKEAMLKHCAYFAKLASFSLNSVEITASLLGAEVSILMNTFPNHLFIFIGSPLPLHTPNFFKRQVPNNIDRPVLDLLTDETVSMTYANATLPVGGILKKYQLLTSELIVSLLVFLFIMLPIVFFGLEALASVQNPIRTDITKSSLSQERKNQ